MICQNTFNPDYAIHPGEILSETLGARGISNREFARHCGISLKKVSLIIDGKAPVTSDMAIQFERVLGVSSAIWDNLNQHKRSFDGYQT